MLKIQIYEIYSVEYPYTGAEKIHGVRTRWNVPGSDDGAVQVRDRILNDFYRKGVVVYAGIREKWATIEPSHATFI